MSQQTIMHSTKEKIGYGIGLKQPPTVITAKAKADIMRAASFPVVVIAAQCK